MSTALAAEPYTASRTIAPQSFLTLTAVEIRKMVTTRSGRWVLGLVMAIPVVALAWLLTHTTQIPPGWGIYSAMVMPVVGMAVPLVGLLAMTAEWTQRTALTTFTLSPRRGRVLGAKFLASIALALAVLAVVFVVLLGGVALGGLISGQTPSYAGIGHGLSGFVVLSILQVTMAAGFGALTAQTAVAVACFYVAPTLWGLIGPLVFKSNEQWLNVFSAFERLSSDRPFDNLSHSLTAVACWVLLPAAVGVVRSMRREVK